MNVSAIIVTRGDVDLEPVLGSLPSEWEHVVWENGYQVTRQSPPGWEFTRRESNGSEVRYVLPNGGFSLDAGTVTEGFPDLSVYGRYAAIKYATGDLIYVQDDDCIVSDPQAILDEWNRIDEFRHVRGKKLVWETYADHVVCNMPPEFRHDFYEDHALVGFGAAFHRDVPERAFERAVFPEEPGDSGGPTRLRNLVSPSFNRTCDVVFTTLTPRVLVDVPKTNLPWAEDESRMYRQPEHVGERARMLELARKVRDS